jgi:hypothetical protein
MGTARWGHDRDTIPISVAGRSRWTDRQSYAYRGDQRGTGRLIHAAARLWTWALRGARYLGYGDAHLFDFVHDLVDCLQEERFGRVLTHRLQLDCETA